MTRRRAADRLILTLLLTLTALMLPACIGGTGLFGDEGGSIGFDPVDEDFTRASPLLSSEGTVSRSCNDAPARTPAEAVFDRGLCLCGSLEEVGSGLTTRSSSHLAGADPGQGNVGINGDLSVVGNFEIDGGLDVAGEVQGVGSLSVTGDLISGSDVSVTGDWAVGGDAWIDGDLQGVGSMEIGSDLYLTGSLQTIGDVRFERGRRGFSYRGAPCGCDAKSIVDVAAEVATRRTQNNNDRLSSDMSTLVLESGDYYFSDPAPLIGARAIEIRGRVGIYVEGNIETIGSLALSIDPEAELSMWVAGRIETIGSLALNEYSARSFKLYMGGSGSALVNVGSAQLVGSVYAPEVDIEFVGDLSVRGALFARNIRGTGDLEIVHDTDASTPVECIDAYLH